MPRTIERDWAVLVRDATICLALAAAVFALSYANGGFDPTTRAYAGISAWWLLGAGAAIGIGVARSRVNRVGLWTLGLLAAFALWTLISLRWAPDAERGFAQFNQISLYVAVLALGIVLGRLVPAFFLVAGVGFAISAVAGVALVSRLFPSTFGVQPSTILTALNNRLSFPLGYWNGLGIEVALAYPLLLSVMVSRRSRLASGLAALPLPILAADMYLTSSRGAFLAAVVAVLAYLLLAPNRWAALAATAFAAIAGAVAVATLHPRHELVSGQMTNPVAVQQGHHAALVIGIACIVGALVWLGLVELGRRLPAPPPLAGWITAGVVALIVVLALALSHPIAKFDAFKSNSASYGGTNKTFIEQHLLSSSGSGRWQFWGAAISEFRAHPLNGGGAGSWGAWWLRHGSLRFFTQYAHSLYLESLAELGIVGFLLITGAVVVGVVGAVRSALILRSGQIAAAAACAIAFFVAAAYDWVWQLAGIAVVGIGMLGIALGALPSSRAGAWARVGVIRPLVALLAVAAILPQVVLLAAGLHLRNSRAAVNAGDGTRARSEALAAKAVEPWAASPYLQLALVAEAGGQYTAAHRWLEEALSHSPQDWSLWFTAARIDAKRGDVVAAKHDLTVARRLNPHSRFLANPE